MIARGIGCVTRTLGDTVLAALPGACVGDGVAIAGGRGFALSGEVVAVERSRVTIVAFGSLAGIGVGDRVTIAADARQASVGFRVLGRALDASGRALDGRDDPAAVARRVDPKSAPPPASRHAIDTPFATGIRVIDALLSIGRGARVGIFGAPGAGKSTLLETIAGAARADACVLALIGERGREAQAWLERIDRRTTIVCATSDRSAPERIRAADIAMMQAETLRSRGMHVLLIVDSLARYAAALRERRVALGESVGRGGYPPAVWAELARYLERAGNVSHGSVTLLATVLSDGGDDREPLSDAARSLLDGHLVLSSALARAGRYPAIDVLASASRTMARVISDEHARDARTVREALARLAASEDARSVGLGPSDDLDLVRALAAEPQLAALLRQDGAAPWSDSIVRLREVAAVLEP